jgi:archaeal type IV pilus assembly protein PilA
LSCPHWAFIQVFEIMAFTKNNEDAVSPVIGVILMVAITVILAAVIAAFVFGMAGNISKTKVVSATLSRPSTTSVTATYQGGQDSSSLVGIVFKVNDVQQGTLGATGGTTILGIGRSKTFNAAANGQVVAIGYFTDGSQQVLLDTKI